MNAETAREKFVDWLARRMTLAGRGDCDDVLKVEPSGKYWLGRLQSAEAVAESDWGDRGERLEPCAFGIKVKPRGAGPWRFRVVTSFRVWLWDKSAKIWKKTGPVRVGFAIEVPARIGIHRYGEEEIASALASVTGRDGLAARIDVEVDTGQSGDHELSVSLVNCSPKEHPDFKDTRLYQSELRVENLDTLPFMLEALEDSFRYDRCIEAYGINCGVRTESGAIVTEDAVTVDRHRPRYWSVDDPMPTMRFMDLAADPIGPAEALLSALRSWGGANWAADVLEHRADAERWSTEMQQQATRAAEEFERECERLAKGIELLKSDEALFRAFTGMNRAMSFSARGKYDSWRPFQLGFLLANLSSVVDKEHEPDVVDVVWFATGGGNTDCVANGDALPIYVVDEEIYRFLPTVVVGTLDKAASISLQASMRGMVGAPLGVCSKEGHGYIYAPRSSRPSGCLVPGCRGTRQALPMEEDKYGPSFRLQDELHLLRDSLGAVDSHYEALYDALQDELCGRKPKVLASSATLTGYEKQVDVLYRRAARVFPVPPPRVGGGFWTADSESLMRRFVAIAPRGVTIEYTVDRLLTELQIAVRDLARDPVSTCADMQVLQEGKPDRAPGC